MSSPEACGLVADRVVMVMLESEVTGIPFLSHTTEGCGEPLTTQNKVAGLFKSLMTAVDEAWTLGGTARKK